MVNKDETPEKTSPDGFGEDLGMMMMLWNPDKVFNSLHFQLLAETPEEQTALQQLFHDNDLSQEFLQALETNALLKNREEAVSKIYLWLDKQQRSGTIKRSIIEIWRHLLPLLEEAPDTSTADMRAFESMDALLVPMPEPPPPTKAPGSSPDQEGLTEAATNDGLDALRRTNVGDLIPASSNEVQAKIMSYLVYEPEPLTPQGIHRADVKEPTEEADVFQPEEGFAAAPEPLVPDNSQEIWSAQAEPDSPGAQEAPAPEPHVHEPETPPADEASQEFVGAQESLASQDLPESPENSEAQGSSESEDGFAVAGSRVSAVPSEALFEDDTPKTPEDFGEFEESEASAIRDALVEAWSEDMSAPSAARLISQPQPLGPEKKKDKARTTNQEKAYRPSKRSIRDFLDDDEIAPQHPRAHEAPLSRQTNPLPVADTEVNDFPLLSAPRGFQPYKPPTPRPETAIKPLPFIPTPSQARQAPDHNPEHPPTLHTKKRPGPHKRIYQTGNYPRIEQIGDTGNHPLVGNDPPSHNEGATRQEESYRPPPQGRQHERGYPPTPHAMQMRANTSARYRPFPQEGAQLRGGPGAPPTGQHPLHTLRQRRTQTNPRMYVDPKGPEARPSPHAAPPNRPRKRAPAHTLAPAPPQQTPAARYSGTPLPNHSARSQPTPLPNHLTRSQRPKPPSGGSARSYTGSQNAFLQEHPRQVPKKPRVKAGLSPEEHRENSRGSLPRMQAVSEPPKANKRQSLRGEDPYTAEATPLQDAAPSLHAAPPSYPGSLAPTAPQDPVQPANGVHVDRANGLHSESEQPAFARTPSIELPAAGTHPQAIAKTEDAFGLHPAEPPSSGSSSGIYEIPSDEFEKLDPQAELNQFLLAEAPTPEPIPAAEAAPAADESQPTEEPPREDPAGADEPPFVGTHGSFDPERYASDEIELIFDEEVERISTESMSTSLAIRMGLTPPPQTEHELMEQLENAPAFEGLDSDSFDELPMAEVGILPTVEFSLDTAAPAEQAPMMEPVDVALPASESMDYIPLEPAPAETPTPTPMPVFATPRQPRTWLVVLLTALIVSTLLVGGTYIGKRWLKPTPTETTRPERDPYPFQIAKIPVGRIFVDDAMLVFVMQKRWRQHATIQQIALRLFAALDTRQDKSIRKVRMLSHKGKHIHWFQLDATNKSSASGKKSSD